MRASSVREASVRRAISILGLALLAGCTGQSPHHAADTTAASASSGARSSSSSRPAPHLAPGAAAVPCDQAIDTSAQPSPLRVVLGVVGLPTSPGYSALQTSRTGEAGPLRLFAKTGMVVKAGAAIDLSLPAPFSRHARIGWGSPGPTASRIVVDRCTSPDGDWLAFAGGYWIDHPACLPLIVRSQGRQETVHIGVGKACAGQKPPASPTES